MIKHEQQYRIYNVLSETLSDHFQWRALMLIVIIVRYLVYKQGTFWCFGWVTHMQDSINQQESKWQYSKFLKL